MQFAGPGCGLCAPAAHTAHGPPSGPEAPALQMQAVDAPLPGRESVFGAHARHVDALYAPTDAEYVPTLQSMHVPGPVDGLYFPAPHNSHSAPIEPAAPAIHTHATLLEGESENAGHTAHVTPVEEYMPAAHTEHVPGPVDDLYVPASHFRHSRPFRPVQPALHVQAALLLLPSDENEFAAHAIQPLAFCLEYVPASHAMHWLSTVEPSIAAFLPDAHLTQALLPGATLYLPVAHATQGPPSESVHPASHTHAASPCVSFVEPMPHSIHGPPLTPVEPGLHVQAATWELPVGENELNAHVSQAVLCVPENVPASHGIHASSVRPPTRTECLPDAQLTQALSPDATLYLPAAQDTQVPPSGPVKPALHLQAVISTLPSDECVFIPHNRQAF